jgi:hypothetical protein
MFQGNPSLSALSDQIPMLTKRTLQHHFPMWPSRRLSKRQHLMFSRGTNREREKTAIKIGTGVNSNSWPIVESPAPKITLKKSGQASITVCANQVPWRRGVGIFFSDTRMDGDHATHGPDELPSNHRQPRETHQG